MDTSVKSTKFTLVEVKDIKKHYKMGDITIKAVDGISFSVEEGSFTVVVGTSGAGKTTVLNILGGMDSCTSGSIRVGGREIGSLSEKELVEYRRHDIGFVFQFYNLIPNLTAKENVELAGQICKNPMPADEALRSVGLEDRMDNFPAQLSGGEQQRVSIARALSKRPKLLLCDEPTGALDYNTGKKILKLLQQKSREDGLTVVLITHNLAITPMADRVIKLQSGKVESDTVNENPLSVDLIEW